MTSKLHKVLFAAAAAFAVGLLFAPVATAKPARATAAPQQAAPAATTNPNEGFLRTWKDVTHKLIEMGEDFPEDKYDYKPTPAQRSFAEQLLHAAGANYYFINPVMGKKPPAEEDMKRDKYKTKADIVAFVKKAFADGATAIRIDRHDRRSFRPSESPSDRLRLRLHRALRRTLRTARRLLPPGRVGATRIAAQEVSQGIRHPEHGLSFAPAKLSPQLKRSCCRTGLGRQRMDSILKN
jgi:hypothetical protein